MKKLDLLGQRFGRLVVTECLGQQEKTGRRILWKCKCDCGNEIVARSDCLRRGVTKSCGCYSRDVHSEQLKKQAVTHKGSNDRLYRIWSGMRSRCGNETHSSYHNYGARGIMVCEEWEHSYPAFKKWAIENGYDENAKRGDCTLDRIDVNGNYCPENCRFISNAEQCNNTRRNHLVTLNGETKTFTQWLNEIGIERSTVYGRIDRGWPIYEAFFTPVNSREHWKRRSTRMREMNR